METNALPKYDMSDNPTNCCPRFNSDGWDEQDLHFNNKLFAKVKTKSFFHIPLNMGSVFPKAMAAIEDAHARNEDEYLMLSYDQSNWSAEHFIAVNKDVPGLEMVRLSGDFLTKIFEGPYKDVPKWEKEMTSYVESKGEKVNKVYFFYTTCPKCAKYYGKNYMVAVAELQ